MRPLVLAIIMGILGAAALPGMAQVLTEEEAKQVIARVGDEEITAGEFARDLQFRVGQLEASAGRKIEPDLRMRRRLMNELIQERILNIAARNAGVEITDKELEEEFETRKQLFDSEEAYQGYLDSLKLTEPELKEHIRSRLRIKTFIEDKAGPLTATPEEIDELYALMKSQGHMTRTANTRDIAVILLRAKSGTDESWRAAEERAEAVKARLDAGEDFQAVAREVSEDPETAPDGGLLIEMKHGSFYPELEAAMDELAVGEVSEPVRSVMGWYLLKILQENKPGTISREKAADRLAKEIVEEKRQAVARDVVAEAQKLIRVEMVKAPEEKSAEEAE